MTTRINDFSLTVGGFESPPNETLFNCVAPVMMSLSLSEPTDDSVSGCACARTTWNETLTAEAHGASAASEDDRVIYRVRLSVLFFSSHLLSTSILLCPTGRVPVLAALLSAGANRISASR